MHLRARCHVHGSSDEIAMLPCSFRLSCSGHSFELAAACQREKEVWISAIRESLSVPPTWTDEPTSSLRSDGKGELLPSTLEDGPFEAINPLPTIQSIPELTNDSDYPDFNESLFGVLGGDTKQTKMLARHDIAGLDPPSHIIPPSRRSSTASVKAIFSPMSSESDTIVIRRSSPTARLQVDQGLQDIISAPCLTARSYACSHEEELFQAPKSNRSGFSRSNSGLSMASMGVVAKNRLTRHESVRVPRRKSLLDGPETIPKVSKTSISRAKSLASRRHSKKLIIAPAMTAEGDEGIPLMPDSPTPFSQCSSMSTSNPSSTLASPTLDAISLPLPPGPPNGGGPAFLLVRDAEFRGNRTHSMVDNVRAFFHSRPTSPTACKVELPNQTPSFAAKEQEMNKTVTPGFLKRWAKGPLHRRVRSAPEISKDQIPKSTAPNASALATIPAQAPIATDISPVLPGLEFGERLSLSHSVDQMPSQQYTMYTFNGPPSRRRSLLSTSTFRLSTHSSTSAEAPSTRRVHRNLSLLQRLRSVDLA